MRLHLFAKLKYESSTIILFVGIRYSMRDLLSDLNITMLDLANCEFYVHIFSLVFRHDFIICVDFTCISASNIASDDVTH